MRIYDWVQRKESGQLHFHEGSVTFLAIWKGQYLLTGSADMRIPPARAVARETIPRSCGDSCTQPHREEKRGLNTVAAFPYTRPLILKDCVMHLRLRLPGLGLPPDFWHEHSEGRSVGGNILARWCCGA